MLLSDEEANLLTGVLDELADQNAFADVTREKLEDLKLTVQTAQSIRKGEDQERSEAAMTSLLIRKIKD